ncbi:MAG: hypothetical protein HC824_08625 [Synechococcales cyanobacterium RM1_1_8]|nr:hypothetical protein [Synechococcales cyanobacterium RM1_1_8]
MGPDPALVYCSGSARRSLNPAPGRDSLPAVIQVFRDLQVDIAPPSAAKGRAQTAAPWSSWSSGV